jgi:isoleucyl-tRNA synthetase
MEELDRWALNQLKELDDRVQDAYNNFEFHTVYHSLHNFCVLDLSSFFLDIIKDRLYTSPKNSHARRSAQTAMHEILEVLVRLMAPILSFTADEIWKFMKGDKRTPSVHADVFLKVNDKFRDPDLSKKWDTIIAVRKEVTKALETSRREKKIGHSLDSSVTLGLSAGLMKEIEPYRDQLRSIFIVSSIVLADFDDLEDVAQSDTLNGLKIKVSNSKDEKCERCWVHDPTVGSSKEHPTICQRCLNSLEEAGINV